MDNKYTATHIFALMESKYNLRVMGTFRFNRKIFDSEKILLDNIFDKVTLKRLVENCLGVVITRCKDSNKLQVISTEMNKGVGKVTRRKGRD